MLCSLAVQGNTISNATITGVAVKNNSSLITLSNNTITSNAEGANVDGARIIYFTQGNLQFPEIGPTDITFYQNKIFNNSGTGIVIGSQLTACASGCQLTDPSIPIPFPNLKLSSPHSP